jgi:hypothetical protein
MFYECLKNINREIGDNFTGLINDIVHETQPDSRHVQNLLASIYLMTPNHSINYNSVFAIAIRVPRMYKLISHIFEKMKDKEEFIGKIPVSEDYWEKLLVNQED